MIRDNKHKTISFFLCIPIICFLLRYRRHCSNKRRVTLLLFLFYVIQQPFIYYVLGNVEPDKAVKWIDLESGGKLQLPKYKEVGAIGNTPGASSLGNEWTRVTRKSKTSLVKREGLSRT